MTASQLDQRTTAAGDLHSLERGTYVLATDPVSKESCTRWCPEAHASNMKHDPMSGSKGSKFACLLLLSDSNIWLNILMFRKLELMTIKVKILDIFKRELEFWLKW